MFMKTNLNAIKNNKNNCLDPNKNYLGKDKFTFFSAYSGDLTCSYKSNDCTFLLHSKYNPLEEATRLVKSQLSLIDYQYSKIIVYGFGCGHHIRVLLELVPREDIIIEIWETNVPYFYEVLKQADFSGIFNDPRTQLKVSDDLSAIAKWMDDWDKNNVFIIIHQPSLRIMPDFLKNLKEVFESYTIFTSSIRADRELLEKNFLVNSLQDVKGIRHFINGFNNVPAIMVSAGPSLSKNMHLLTKAKEHCLLCCVGTALKPLLAQNIIPDFFMITDPKELVLEQIKGLEHKNVPLFFLSTVNYKVPLYYLGPKFIVYQKGYRLAEERANQLKEPLVNTGGSVSTSLFDLLIKLGFEPICLVGQDLAYSNKQSHVEGSHNYRQFSDLARQDTVLSFTRNGYVKTAKNLKQYLNWFEKAVRDNPNKSFYNATEGGAYINGFKHVTLAEFIDQHKNINVKEFRFKFQSLLN